MLQQRAQDNRTTSDCTTGTSPLLDQHLHVKKHNFMNDTMRLSIVGYLRPELPFEGQERCLGHGGITIITRRRWGQCTASLSCRIRKGLGYIQPWCLRDQSYNDCQEVVANKINTTVQYNMLLLAALLQMHSMEILVFSPLSKSAWSRSRHYPSITIRSRK